MPEMLQRVKLFSIDSRSRSHSSLQVYIRLQGKPDSLILNSYLVTAERANIGCKWVGMVLTHSKIIIYSLGNWLFLGSHFCLGFSFQPKCTRGLVNKIEVLAEGI